MDRPSNERNSASMQGSEGLVGVDMCWGGGGIVRTGKENNRFLLLEMKQKRTCCKIIHCSMQPL